MKNSVHNETLNNVILIESNIHDVCRSDGNRRIQHERAGVAMNCCGGQSGLMDRDQHFSPLKAG